MTIDFKDFVPEDQTRFLSFGRKYEAPREVLARANSWIEESGVDLLHVETLLLPGASKDDEGDATHQTGELAVVYSWSQIIRVWFRESGG